MIRKKLVLFFVAGFMIYFNLSAQDLINLRGNVKSSDGLPLENLIIANQRSFTGNFLDPSEIFAVTFLRNDTLIFSSRGYQLKKICLRDSSLKKEYFITVVLEKLKVSLPTLNITNDRNLDEINKEIEKLGARETYTVKGLASVMSPVTFLYERFSRFEQSKRKVALMENEDRKNGVLKDLFRIYIKNDIINLNEKEFDSFIAYCDLSEKFIKTASEFDLVMHIKSKYESFVKNGISNEDYWRGK